MKPILFIDFDGTLCHDRFWRSVDKATQEKIQNFLFTSTNPLVSEWMKGSHTSEEINNILSNWLQTIWIAWTASLFRNYGWEVIST